MGSGDCGTLIGIARRQKPRAPMEIVTHVAVAVGGGLEGDHKGLKFPRRGVTLLSREAWAAAIEELTDLAGAVPLPWTARRSNLLVEGVVLPATRGAIIHIGAVHLEVTDETWPCRRMEQTHTGLLKALAKDARGGVTCRVVEGGSIRIGDEIVIVLRPPAHRPRLPG